MDLEKIEKKGTLLIVEDEPEILLALKTAAEAVGFVVYGAKNGRLALEVFEHNHLDLIVSDIKMPDMSGLEFLSQLRLGGGATACLFITAYGDKESALEALRLGAFDFLEKPFAIGEFQKLISSAIAGVHRAKNGPVTLPRVSPVEGTKELDLALEAAGKNNYSPGKTITAELAVSHVRAFRRASEDFRLSELQNADKWASLSRELCEEALPLLLAGKKTLKWFEGGESSDHDLSYLKETMRLVRDAAEALGSQPVFTLAGLLEDCYQALRELGSSASADWLQAAEAAHDLLVAQLSCETPHPPLTELTHPEIYSGIRDLKRDLLVKINRRGAEKRIGPASVKKIFSSR